MKRLILILFFVGLFFYSKGAVTATEISEFRFQAPVKGEAPISVPVRLVLPYEIIKKSSAGFSDVRIFDDHGMEVPYVIYAQSRPKERPRSFSWEIVHYQYTDTTQTIVLKRPTHIDVARDLRMTTPTRDFVRDVKVYTSKDQEIWDLLATGSYFDFSSQVNFRKNELDIPEITGKYLKISLTDISRPMVGGQRMRFQYKDLSFSLEETMKGEIKIDHFTSYIGKKNKEEHFYDEVTIRSPETFIDKDGNTILKLGELNIPVDKVILSISNPYFYRHAELWAADKDSEESYHIIEKNVLYKIPEISETKTQFPVHFNRPAHVRLKIINNDNPPLIVENVTIRWIRRNLYFMPGEGRSYTLYFGGGDIRAPEYELKRIVSNQYDKLLNYKQWNIGNILENSAYTPKTDDVFSQRAQKYLFVGLVLLLVCGLGFWVFKLMKKISEN